MKTTDPEEIDGEDLQKSIEASESINDTLDTLQALGLLVYHEEKSSTIGDETPTLSPVSSEVKNDDAAPETGIRMVVSSKHMTLASPVFRAMLRPSSFKEGTQLQSKGKATVPLPEDDPKTFKIIVDIIHGRSRHVPHQVDIHTMTEIAIIVDKYQMEEVIERYADAWIDILKVNLPRTLNTEVYQWITISWVFNKDLEFEKMTAIAQRESIGNFKVDFDRRFPVPESVLDGVAVCRGEVMRDAFTLLKGELKSYQGLEISCTRMDGTKNRVSCDSMVLGSLLQSITKLQLYPTPRRPYMNWCFCDMRRAVKSLEVEALCDRVAPYKTDDHGPGHGLHNRLNVQYDKFEDRLCGLKLDDFKPH